MSLHSMTHVLAFPSVSRDTPLDDEQLATHRSWAAWATGQGNPDIPLTYRPVNRPFDIDHPPFAIGDRVYLTIDSFFSIAMQHANVKSVP